MAEKPETSQRDRASTPSAAKLFDRVLRHPYWTAGGVIIAIIALFFGSQQAPAEPELLCRYEGARALGWPGSGNKTIYCNNSGYNQGNFNIEGSGYGPGGICIDMAVEPCFTDYKAGALPDNVRCEAIGTEKRCLLYPK